MTAGRNYSALQKFLNLNKIFSHNLKKCVNLKCPLDAYAKKGPLKSKNIKSIRENCIFGLTETVHVQLWNMQHYSRPLAPVNAAELSF